MTTAVELHSRKGIIAQFIIDFVIQSTRNQFQLLAAPLKDNFGVISNVFVYFFFIFYFLSFKLYF